MSNNLIVVSTIKEGVIDEIKVFGDSEKAEKCFEEICINHLANKEDISDMLDDGYFMWANGSVCITWPVIIE